MYDILFSTSEVLFQCRINGRARCKKNSKQLFRIKKTGKMFISSSDLYKKWALFASCYVNRAKKTQTIDFPCNLSIKCYYKNHAHEQDLDNVIASVCDVLEDCAVVKNDKLFYSYNGSCKYFDSENEYLEVIVTKL